MTQTTKPNVKVVVKRSEWGRGMGGTQSKLFNPMNGMHCCLGFACLSMEMPRSAIEGKGYPFEISSLVKNNPFRYDMDRSPVYELTQVNDAFLHDRVFLRSGSQLITSEETREAIIQRLGLEIGLEFTFED